MSPEHPEPGLRELRVFAVDDEPPAVRRLAEMLAACEGVVVTGTETRAAEVIPRCRELRPDLVFLDVEMPGVSGVRLARQLRELEPRPAMVFVTAYEDYAVDAFELAVVDYLVKPVRAERLERALERVRRQLDSVPQCLAVRLGERLMSIPLDRIRLLQAEDKYTCVHHLDGEALVDDSLVRLEERFGDRFVRIHRNALVSRAHVRGLYRDADGCERLELQDVDLRPEVSRRNRAAVRRLIRGET